MVPPCEKWYDVISVTINGKVRLYEAPYYSGIEEGDEVIVEWGFNDTSIGIVKTVTHNMYDDNETLELICKLLSISLPLPRVLRRIEYIDMKYKEDTDENNEETA